MEKMISYCGYNCHLCAARSDDEEIRKKMIAGWKKYFGHQQYTVENSRCDGCKADGRLIDSSCEARPCAIAKGVDICSECDEFPCDKVKKLFASKEGMIIYTYPKSRGISFEDYELCMRQFDSMPNLLRSLIKQGKLPDWVLGQ